MAHREQTQSRNWKSHFLITYQDIMVCKFALTPAISLTGVPLPSLRAEHDLWVHSPPIDLGALGRRVHGHQNVVEDGGPVPGGHVLEAI